MLESHAPLQVLVIDDDADTCRNLRDILELDDHRVITAHSGEEAQRVPDLHRSAVILLDRKLQDTSAEELIPRLQEQAPGADILIVTGHADFESAVAALRQGAADYLLKPINPELLRASLRRVARHREAESELRKEREFAKSVIENTQAAVLVMDAEARIVRMNSFLEKLTGFSFAEVKGKDWFETFLPESDRARIRLVFQRALAGHAIKGHINPVVTHDGQERSIAWWATRQSDGDEHSAGVLAIGHDVTELQEAQRCAMQADRLAAIGKAMAGLAHESRNALQRSQAGLEMLARRLVESPDLLDLTRRIQKAQDDLHQLYEEVREYAAPIRLRKTECDLAKLLSEVWDDLSPQRLSRDASLRIRHIETSASCEIDRFGIRQVFRNILENSLAACSDPVEVIVDFTGTSSGDQQSIQVVLRDNGPGLTSEAREHIFEEFFTTKTRGTGLGMAICRRIVEAHGGQIEVGDEPGAVIIVTLPRSKMIHGETTV